MSVEIIDFNSRYFVYLSTKSFVISAASSTPFIISTSSTFASFSVSLIFFLLASVNASVCFMFCSSSINFNNLTSILADSFKKSSLACLSYDFLNIASISIVSHISESSAYLNLLFHARLNMLTNAYFVGV